MLISYYFDNPNLQIQKVNDFFTNIFNTIELAKPTVSSLTKKYKSKSPTISSDKIKEPIYDEEFLKTFLQLDPVEINSLKLSHEIFMKNTPNSIPNDLNYVGNGIVYAGGGKYNWLTLLSIKSLRRTGSTLPVEVLIPTIDDYEIDLCTQIFPSLNARCIFLPEVLGKNVIQNFKFKGYQYKVFAILASSFQNVLLLDSDNMPAIKPDYLFDSEVFQDNGLVTWPDFWRRTTSPYFYDIADVHVGERIRFGYTNYGIYTHGISVQDEKNISKVPFHDREGAIPDSSTESGQLLVNKKTHFKMLLLSLYYNTYGPDHYYPLLSQGSTGEGDKDTFLAAAVKTGSKFYQVNKFVGVLGYNADGGYHGTSMVQHDPVEDYQKFQKNANILNLINEDENDLVLKPASPKIVFVHSNFPKLNPAALKKNKILVDKEEKRHRYYSKNKIEGFDLELKIWEDMRYFICELQLKLLAFGGMGTDDICEELNEQIKYLESTTI
ncbi:alpha-mannosyltransferase [Ascoidea rubescens DSM 1968]|uniref:Glycosyltransferase family 71 protein n=1 Tax=Ascoidea rubescens DSM 1968 TaxID=1344418 RepID=A0A1D2VC40_9ASCO|nr:glycosyltransferase family 71 protein [Ascoidea rubescens DSM 1968]ODV59053.1 glycosyltransferase family 71 protein [Ascoidea rubescens DSM 1968]